MRDVDWRHGPWGGDTKRAWEPQSIAIVLLINLKKILSLTSESYSENVPGPRREIQIRERTGPSASGPGPPRPTRFVGGPVHPGDCGIAGPPATHTIRGWPGPPGRLRNSRAPREYGKNVSEQESQHAITE